MRLVQITPGTDNFQCSACQRDHALVAALGRALVDGHGEVAAPEELRGAGAGTGLGDAPDPQYQLTAAPTLAGTTVVVGGRIADNVQVDMPGGVVRGFDVITGALRWAFDPGDPSITGAPPAGKTYARSTPNVWSSMSYDAASNTVFMPVGSASVDLYGKTRSALELLQRAEPRGWSALWLSANPPADALDAWQRLLLSQARPLLLVIDYAEGRQPDLLRWLRTALDDALSRPDGPRVHLLCLSRSTDWWHQLSRQPEMRSDLQGMMFLGLALIAIDLATEGKVFRRGGCGCAACRERANAGEFAFVGEGETFEAMPLGEAFENELSEGEAFEEETFEGELFEGEAWQGETSRTASSGSSVNRALVKLISSAGVGCHGAPARRSRCSAANLR